MDPEDHHIINGMLHTTLYVEDQGIEASPVLGPDGLPARYYQTGPYPMGFDLSSPKREIEQ